MAESYVDRVANELADLALADQARSGDIGIVDMIGEVLGASSQTLQETYLTAIRVRRAEQRARTILAERAGTPVVPLAELIEDNSSIHDRTADIEDAEIAQEAAPAAAAPKPIEEAQVAVDTKAQEAAALEAELEAAAARVAAEKAAKAKEEEAARAAKAEAAKEAKLAAEKAAKAKKAKEAAAAQPVVGPWDFVDGAPVPAEPEAAQAETPEPEPDPEPTKPAAPAMPRRVKR